MANYVILLRGVNVGGTSKVSMPVLRELLTQAGCSNVVSYINSGNLLATSDMTAKELSSLTEALLQEHFTIAAGAGKALVITAEYLLTVVAGRPAGFGEQPDLHHSDAIFLLDVPDDEAFEVFTPKEGVDRVWLGNAMIYSERVSALRTRSRLNRIMSSPFYKQMTIRSWQTVRKLSALAEQTFSESDADTSA